jgi:hypothetical protein
MLPELNADFEMFDEGTVVPDDYISDIQGTLTWNLLLPLLLLERVCCALAFWLRDHDTVYDKMYIIFFGWMETLFLIMRTAEWNVRFAEALFGPSLATSRGIAASGVRRYSNSLRRPSKLATASIEE